MAEKKPKGMPSSLGECVDMLYNLRSARLEAQKVVDDAKEREVALRSHILANFAKGSLEGAAGSIAVASIKRNAVAKNVDWDRAWAYISRTKSWDLVQKRLSITALVARWDAGKKFDWVERDEVEELSVTKRPAKKAKGAAA